MLCKGWKSFRILSINIPAHVTYFQALHHLDKFASLGNSQLYKLNDNKLFDAVTKQIKSEDSIIKRFAFKLLAQFVSTIGDCKKKLLNDDTLIAEAVKIFTSSSDDIVVEFSSILLHHICDDPKRIDLLGRDEIFLKSIFDKFKSHDPDILLHTVRLLNVVMRNSMVIESVLVHKDFPIKNIQIELRSGMEEVQVAALEGFSW